VPLDSVRCTRGRTLQTPRLRVSRRSSAIIHRTVRYTSGAMAIYAQQSTLTGEQCSTVTRQKSEQIIGAPDCSVPHEDKASNGRPAPSPNDRGRGGAPDCSVRPSLPAFSNGYILVGGYKYHPNRPLQGVGAQATFQVI
jgi:hypothetical protein